MTADPADRALDVAEEVADALARRGVRTALIGAVAMAVHGYTRATQDIDLATVGVPLATLREVVDELRATGHPTELREPDASDPLGGLIRVEVGDDLQIDVVNFGNPFTGATRRVGTAALDAPTLPIPGRQLMVVGVESLVLLKLAAGSRFDLQDAAHLLTLHPEIDRDALRTRCVVLREVVLRAVRPTFRAFTVDTRGASARADDRHGGRAGATSIR